MIKRREKNATDDTQRPYCELLIVFDGLQTPAADIEKILLDHAGLTDQTLPFELLSNPGGGYYKNKDFGAQRAHGDLIIFLDSDVIPEPGWLEQILLPFDDPAIRLVTGCAHIEPNGLIGKTFALTWFFPLRNDATLLTTVTSFFANNLAMRRSLYDKYPFPDLPGTSRGSCLILAETLADDNVALYKAPSARVRHPAPNGFKHFVFRGLAQGRDRLFREREFGSPWSASWPAAMTRLASNWVVSWWQVCTKFRRVGLNPLMIPAAIVVSGTYYFLYFSGETMLFLNLRWVYKIRV